MTTSSAKHTHENKLIQQFADVNFLKVRNKQGVCKKGPYFFDVVGLKVVNQFHIVVVYSEKVEPVMVTFISH